MQPLLKSVASITAERWRELLGFALLFRLVESLLFAPLAGLAGKWLVGQTVLDSTALVSFLLSPRGFLSLVFAAVTAVTIRLVEHAGLSTIFFGALEGRRVSSRQALRLVWRELFTLVRIANRFVGLGFLTMLPLLVMTGAIAKWLLPRHDINYYLKLRPPEFITVAIVIGVVALVTAAVMVALVVRWRWVVQVAIFQQMEGKQAFSESAKLTRGLRWKLTGVLFFVILVSLALGLVASFVGTAFTSIVLGIMGRGVTSLAISFGILLVLRTVVGSACTFLASCVDAGVFTSLYRRRITVRGVQASLPEMQEIRQESARRWLRRALVAGLAAFVFSGTLLALKSLPEQPPITIHAHRGVSSSAPENTLAATRAAIEAGADYLETDVQLTKDDVLVVAHDSDFSRLGDVAKKVWDLTYEEIRAIPLGGRSAPEFRDEFAPTFDALLATAKGRIKVNIELKYYGEHQPGLARKVVDAVRARGMLGQVVIQCLEYEPLLEVRNLAPEVPIGYLLSFNAREPSRLEVDFLGAEQNRIDRSFIVDAHRSGQKVYAWTVNTADDMQRLLDLGVDGVITDQAALARKTVDEYLSRSKAERAVRRIRAWLAE